MLPQMMLFQQKQHQGKRLLVSVHDAEEVARVMLREILAASASWGRPSQLLTVKTYRNTGCSTVRSCSCGMSSTKCGLYGDSDGPASGNTGVACDMCE